MNEKEKRFWWLSGLLSFLVPGLGQVYNGETTKGLFYYFLISTWSGLIFSLLYYLMKNPMTQTGLAIIVLLFIVSIVAGLLIIIEAIHSALKDGADRPLKRYNRWYVYLIVIFVVSWVDHSMSFTIHDIIIKPYKIPSRSMEPTIKAGDYLVCSRLYYRYHNPDRGDLIIFKYPNDENVDYIKRIVGIPGDMIELRQNTLYVNGQEFSEPYAVYNHSSEESYLPSKSYGPYFISENEYFVMGDNRDNSSDSRVFGTVKQQNIQGKAILVYFSWNRDIPAWNIIGRLFSIRFSRIGDIL